MSILLQQKKIIPINFKEILPELSKRHRATHHIHKYPAKLIPHIPNYLINKFTKKEDIILDPFCGSGTTLLESLLCDRNALGVEINPVARLIAKVKTTPININELKTSAQICYKEIKKCKTTDIPEFENRDLWFTKKTQVNLAKIKTSIDNMDVNQDIHDFFLVCFCAIIRKVSNADPRDILPQMAKCSIQLNVLNEFLRQLDFNIERMRDLSNSKTTSRIIGEDAKKINLRQEVNMVITSPPYLSAMEYFRNMKLEYYWLSNGNVESYRELARQTINGEAPQKMKKELQPLEIPEIDRFVAKIYKKSPKYGFKTSKYFFDLYYIMNKMYNSLLDDGHCAIIIGNSKVLDHRVHLNTFLPIMGKKIGFNFKLEILDEIKFHRFATKRKNDTNRIYNEHIILFQKL